MDLVLTIAQKQALSQKMMLSAQILQMSSIELLDYIKDMAVENPVVELELPENTEEQDKFQILKSKMEWLESSDEQNKTYYAQDTEDEDENDDWKFKKATGESLKDYLTSQINVQNIDKKSLAIAHYIIDCLNENGYLYETDENLSKQLSTPIEEISSIMARLQNLEPAGVFARDLKECLLLQIEKHPNPPSSAKKIVANCLEELGKNQLPVIAKKLKISIDEVINAREFIKSLNPKPGNSFFTDKNLEFITPDVLVVNKDGNFMVILDDKSFPKIHISSYYAKLADQSSTDATKAYVMKKINQAQWAIKCIEKRNHTLTRTVETLVDMQKDFFTNGQGNLKPMRLLDISTLLELHESTISRAVKDKYLQCSWGVFPLNYFFSASITSNAEDGSLTSDNIKEKIKDIISAEDKTSPLSDRVITEMLGEQEINISRRTVAKYREALGIPSTGGRKTF